MTHNLDLLFVDAPIFEETPDARSQLAKVFIRASTWQAYPGFNELQFITPECVSIGEFEAEIDRLQAELEFLRMRARGEFQAAKSAPSN
jgi:hypothetical protein